MEETRTVKESANQEISRCKGSERGIKKSEKRMESGMQKGRERVKRGPIIPVYERRMLDWRIQRRSD